MPFTPYHFGPSGLLGLAFYRHIDLPLFIFANVAVDVEVLIDMIYYPGPPVHKMAHTLIGAAGVGIMLACAGYPFRNFFRWFMGLFKLDYNPTFMKMISGGVLGSIFHVTVDSFCWYDVGLLWPWKRYNRIYRLLGANSSEKVKIICLISFVFAVILYLLILWHKSKRSFKNE